MRATLLLTLFFSLFSPLLAQEPDGHGPVLTTSGQGEIRVEPDLAVVRVGVVAQAASARTAQEEVNGKLEKVVSAVENLGLQRRHIQTSQLMLQPVYSRERSETRRIEAYSATYTVAIRVQDLSLAGPVIDAALMEGANRLDGVSFDLADDEAARLQALEAALRNARAKAEVLAETAGLKILEVLEISEGGTSFQPPSPRMMAMERASAATPVLAGELTVTAQVTVRYQLGPR